MKITSTPHTDTTSSLKQTPPEAKPAQTKSTTNTNDMKGIMQWWLGQALVQRFDYALDFTGTTTRKLYWLILIIVGIVLSCLEKLTLALPSLLVLIGVVLIMGAILVQLTNQSRRLNDVQWSPWLLIIPALPDVLVLFGAFVAILNKNMGSEIISTSSAIAIIPGIFSIILGCISSKTTD